MFAYSAQDLILEPFAGMVFGLSPAQSTAASGMHQTGLLVGMLATAAVAPRFGTSARWASAGCAMSALFFVLLSLSPLTGSVLALKATLVGLGFGNGMYSIGALASMMALTADKSDGRAGLRMGVFGAAQAVAMGTGNFIGAAGSDVARSALGSSTGGYVVVFAVEAIMFAIAAVFALRATARTEVRFALASADGDTLLGAMR
jgi:BCD family chlorophyll transporter-like MFS transporter